MDRISHLIGNTSIFSSGMSVIFTISFYGLEQDASNYRPQAISSLLFVFVSKVLLNHSHTHLFTYCVWLFFHYNGRVE